MASERVDAPTTEELVRATSQPTAATATQTAEQYAQQIESKPREAGNAPSTLQIEDNLRGTTPVPGSNSWEGSNASNTHPSTKQMEAAAEAGVMGGGTNPTSADQTEQTTDMAQEKELNLGGTEAEREGITASSSDADPTDVPKANEQAPPKSKAKIALIMFGLCMATFLAALDTTIITTALPTIAAAFDASSADYTWVGSSYLLAAAAATPSWGKISDIWGRKPVIMAANIVFFVGSIMCAVAPTINVLLGGRVVQGIGGGGLFSLTNICISDLFSMRERGMYFGVIGMVWALASALGPVLGGVFTELVTWRWCFYINLPCDGLALIVLFFFLDIETPKTPFKAGIKAIDWLGSLAIVGGTVMFLLGLEFGGVTFPWKSATVICLIVFGVVTVGIFFVIEKFIPKYPIMPLRIFSTRNNIASLLVCFCHGWVFIAGSYYMPLYFQAVLGASPLLSGVYTFPFVLTLSFTSAATGVVIRKTGQYRRCIWFGFFFMTLGFGLYVNFPPYHSWPRIILFQIIAGLGVGPNFQAPLIALQSRIEPRDIASATATFAFTRNLASAMSVVVGGVILQSQLGIYIAQTNLPASVQATLADGGAGANTGLIDDLPSAEHDIAASSYTMALRDIWIFYVCIAFIGFMCSFMIDHNNLSRSHEVTKTGLAEQEKHRLEQKQIAKDKRMSRQSIGGAQGNGNAAGEEV